jgi:hypothetical protein
MSAPIAKAQANCITLKDLVDVRLNFFEQIKWELFNLEAENKSKYLLFHSFVLENPKDHEPRWLLVNQNLDSAKPYCILGKSKTIYPLKDLHDANFEEKFGLPGSGLRRCNKIDDPLGSLKVRAWANQELGRILIFQLDADDNSSFTVLLSYTGNYWILLRQDEPSSSCYHARGAKMTVSTVK